MIYRIQGSENLTACAPQAASGGGVLFDVLFSGACNVSRHHDDSNRVVHTITLWPQPGVVLTGPSPVYECSCKAPAEAAANVSVEQTTIPPITISGQGTFGPTMQLFSNQSYIFPLAPGAILPAETDRFYVQVASQDEADIVGWINCTGAPSGARADPFTVSLLQEACPTGPVSSEPLVVNSQTHIVRLAIDRFSFAGTPVIHFACWVERCSAAPCGQCGGGGGRRLQGRLEASSKLATSWLRVQPDVGPTFPAPIPPKLLETVWPPSPSAPPPGALASNFTLYGCDVDATQPAFRNVVEAVIVTQLSVEEENIQVTQVAHVPKGLRRRLQASGVSAILVGYVVLGGGEVALDQADSKAFMQALDKKFLEHNLGSASGGSVFFAQASPVPAQEEFENSGSDRQEAPAEQEGVQGLWLWLLLAALGGAALIVLIGGAVLCLWWLVRRQCANPTAPTEP